MTLVGTARSAMPTGSIGHQPAGSVSMASLLVICPDSVLTPSEVAFGDRIEGRPRCVRVPQICSAERVLLLSP